MVYDCFQYNGETDILDIRLNTLCDCVDYFVIAEATVTHRGKPKELTFKAPEQFKDKIKYIVVYDCPDSGDNGWPRDSFQRNCLVRGLTSCKASDIIIISDADEIPDPDAIKNKKLGCYQSQISNYYFNTIEDTSFWVGPSVQYYCTVKQLTPQVIRDSRFNGKIITPGGWHFTYITSNEGIVKKLRAFTHSEWDSPEKHEEVLRAKAGLTSFVSHNKMKVVDIQTGYFPEYLKKNLDKYKHLLAP